MDSNLRKQTVTKFLSRWYVVLGLAATIPTSALILLSMLSFPNEPSPYHFWNDERVQVICKLTRTEELMSSSSLSTAFQSSKELKEAAATYRKLLQIQRAEEQLSDIFRVGISLALIGQLTDISLRGLMRKASSLCKQHK